jgi:fumarate hydratase subunit alpha
MRQLSTELITAEVARLCIEANYSLGEDVLQALQKAAEQEESLLGREILQQLLQNAEIARREKIPICQDTGFVDIFLEIGQELRIVGGDLTEAINEGVRKGYKEGYLRKSIVFDPLGRINTGDNTPAVIHTEILPGDRLKVSVLPKGAGSENMSGLAMLRPADGVEGIKRFILDSVEKAGGNPCPPLIVGVGLGGTAEKTLYLAKKSLLRPLGSSHPDSKISQLERELLEEINATGIGPLGLGGRITALAVHIESYACHIASLPVAVNLQCHAARYKEAIL